MHQSSILRKFLNGLSGILLIGFLITHLGGNALYFLGPEAYNGYGKHLKGLGWGLALPIAELLLAGLFIYHIITGLQLARSRQTSRKKNSSDLMLWSGLLLFVFLIWHIVSVRFQAPDNLYQLLVESIDEPWELLFYLLGIGSVDIHLVRGTASAGQSLGWHTPWQRRASYLTGATFGLGFAVIAISVFLGAKLS